LTFSQPLSFFSLASIPLPLSGLLRLRGASTSRSPFRPVTALGPSPAARPGYQRQQRPVSHAAHPRREPQTTRAHASAKVDVVPNLRPHEAAAAAATHFSGLARATRFTRAYKWRSPASKPQRRPLPLTPALAAIHPDKQPPPSISSPAVSPPVRPAR
jgi:hypothetical protein